MHTMDVTRLSDALHYSTRYNSKMGREGMDVVMLDACVRNRNVTSVAMAWRGAEAAEPRLPRTPFGEQMMRLMREDGQGLGARRRRPARTASCSRACSTTRG